jgi:chemotaxis-related protein WspD
MELQPARFQGVETETPSAQAQAKGASCWSQIGVYGNSSCPELTAYVHCRNCPIYSKAGHELLDRPLPAGYRGQWTEHFARERKPRELTSVSAIPFRVGSEWLALPTRCFQEIAERRPIHSVPHVEQMVLGLANVRGELLICVSLGHLLGLANVPPRNLLRLEYGRLLVFHWNGHRTGFPVAEVHGPHRFHPEQVKPPPAMLAKSNPAYTESLLLWQQRTLVLLDPELIFSALNRTLS